MLEPTNCHWWGHQTSPTVVSLKGRLPQKLQSKSTLSCKIVQIYNLFRHGFIKKPKSKSNRNRKRTYFVHIWRISKNRSWYWFDCKCFSRVDTKHKMILDILLIYFLLYHLSFRKMEGVYSCLPSKDSLNYSLSLFKGWFHLWSFYSVQNASCLFTCI